MRADAIRRAIAAQPRRSATWIALAAVFVGVFSTWTKDVIVTLNGIQGPNDGWLVLILLVPTLLWERMAERGSWTGVVGVLGAALVICWTAIQDWLDARNALGASVGHGLLLVVAGGVVLAAVALSRGFELVPVL